MLSQNQGPFNSLSCFATVATSRHLRKNEVRLSIYSINPNTLTVFGYFQLKGFLRVLSGGWGYNRPSWQTKTKQKKPTQKTTPPPKPQSFYLLWLCFRDQKCHEISSALCTGPKGQRAYYGTSPGGNMVLKPYKSWCSLSPPCWKQIIIKHFTSG